jgi:hypothetical protein
MQIFAAKWQIEVFCTLPSQWFLAPAMTLHVSTTVPHDANSDVSSEMGDFIRTLKRLLSVSQVEVIVSIPHFK